MAKQTPYRYSADVKEIKQEKEGGLKISLNQAMKRTSKMTGVSKSTIERLMKRDKTKEDKPEQPRMKRVQLDEFDLGFYQVNVYTAKQRVRKKNTRGGS